MREDIREELEETLPGLVVALELLREVDDLIGDLVRPEIVDLLRLAIAKIDRLVEREIFEAERNATRDV